MLASWLWCHRRKFLVSRTTFDKPRQMDGAYLDKFVTYIFSDTPVSLRYSEQDIEQRTSLIGVFVAKIWYCKGTSEFSGIR